MKIKLSIPSLLFVSLLFLLGVGTGAGLVLVLEREPPSSPERELHAGQTGLLNPLLDIHTPESRKPELAPFHEAMEVLVARLEMECEESRIAAYFNDLNDGTWIGIRETEGFFPASLVKVPIVIAALRQAQEDPGFLGREVLIPAAEERTAPTGGFITLRRGLNYTIMDLIEESAIRSSNDAAWQLLNRIDKRFVNTAARLSGRDDDPSQFFEPSHKLAPIEVAAYFRVLYNATFLDRRMSQIALEVFSKADFNDGLVAGVPPGTIVANKYGQATILLGDREMFALHDCGIVYHPRRPFLLCVMTTGCDPSSQQKAIAAIARLAWEETELLP